MSFIVFVVVLKVELEGTWQSLKRASCLSRGERVSILIP